MGAAWASILLVILISGSQQNLRSQGGKIPPRPTGEEVSKFPWAKEDWTADETPYLAVRKEVEEFVRGWRPSNTHTALFERTKLMMADSKANPKDPVKLFRGMYYAYTTLGLEETPEAKKLVQRPDGWMRLSMRSVPSPHSREFNRLRFLTEGGLAQDFLDLAYRLYDCDPNDVPVIVKLVWTNVHIGGDDAKAIQIVEKLLKTGDLKRWPEIYYAYAFAYHGAIRRQFTQKNIDRAFWGYDHFLASVPSWRTLAREANDRKKDLTRGLAERKKTP